jgi:hypothetical protein
MDLLDRSLPATVVAQTMELDALRDALIATSASIAAAQARLAQAMVVFRARGGDASGSGFSSFGQWASVDLGLSSRAASTLVDVAAEVADMPTVRAAWEAGELSTNKVTTIVGVATPESEANWCAMGLEASATQLSRIASAYRRNQRYEAERDRGELSASDKEALCGARWHTRDDGLIELLAVLPVDDAAVVRAALESIMELDHRANAAKSDDADESGAAAEADDEPEPLRRPTAQRMSDALAEMAARALATGPVPIVRGEHTEVVLHIDADYLAGKAGEGLCHLTNTPGIDLAGAQTLACDAKLRAMVRGADGTHVDLGRSQRLVSDKQRRLLNARDHGCRFPGCTNGRYVDAHHVHFWEDGGETNLANLVSLCHRHHRLLHQGDFGITADGHQHFTFHDRWGEPIGGRRNRPPGAPPGPVPGTTRARSGGNPDYSIDLAVCALAG